jgi:hypothetical protein
MNEFEFLVLAISEWPTLTLLSAVFGLALFQSVKRVVVGGIFDPLVLALVLGYSVNYGVIMLLFVEGKSSLYLTALMLAYGLVLIGVFRWRSRMQRQSAFVPLLKVLAPASIANAAFATALALYLLLSFFIISSIGFGIFAETNRFEAARGFGSYIRLMDFLCPFIVACSTLKIHASRRKRVLKVGLLVIFIVYASMVNGAKIGVIFNTFTAFFTLAIVARRVRIRPGVAIAGLAAGVAFSVLALSINLEKNNIEEGAGATELAGAGLVVERFVYRLIASGDSSYLLLPNDVVDKITTDSVVVRFLSPFIGIGNFSNLLGYNVADYSVGRQALLYYDPGYEISGGPTSHFDLFSYVYFGPAGGVLFVIALAWLLGSINHCIRTTRARPSTEPNQFRIALLATLWTRGVLVIVEPTVALAYIVDVLVFFSLLSFLLQFVLHPRALRAPVAAPLPAA